MSKSFIKYILIGLTLSSVALIIRYANQNFNISELIYRISSEPEPVEKKEVHAEKNEKTETEEVLAFLFF